MAKAKTAKKTKKKASKRGSAMGYRVLVLVKTGADSYTARRVGRLAKGMTSAEILTILKKLAPKKSTTAVAVTKSGSIHLAARARKAGGKNKTSQRVARIAAKARRKTSKKK